jgi:SlyX protein
METTITDLEIRFTHQEASLDELTKTVVEQQKMIEGLGKEIEQIKLILRDISASNIASPSEETPPPHY